MNKYYNSPTAIKVRRFAKASARNNSNKSISNKEARQGITINVSQDHIWLDEFNEDEIHVSRGAKGGLTGLNDDVFKAMLDPNYAS